LGQCIAVDGVERGVEVRGLLQPSVEDHGRGDGASGDLNDHQADEIFGVQSDSSRAAACVRGRDGLPDGGDFAAEASEEPPEDEPCGRPGQRMEQIGGHSWSPPPLRLRVNARAPPTMLMITRLSCGSVWYPVTTNVAAKF